MSEAKRCRIPPWCVIKKFSKFHLMGSAPLLVGAVVERQGNGVQCLRKSQAESFEVYLGQVWLVTRPKNSPLSTIWPLTQD